MNKIYPSATAALAGIVKDGQTIAVGGFGLCGIPDALIAAQAIEHGATLVTADRGFARFPRLSWRHPLD